MPAVDNSNAPVPSPDGETAHLVQRELVNSIRRRLGFATMEPGEWTACPAPSNLLVIGGGGEVAPCEYIWPSPATGPLHEAFAGDRFVALRKTLARGAMPAVGCGTCSAWLDQDLEAPPVRDYGALKPTPGDVPRVIVLRLHDQGHLTPAVTASLPALLENAERLVLECGSLADSDIAERIAALPREFEARLELRLRRFGAPPDACLAVLGGRPVAAIELDLTSTDRADDRADELAVLAMLAQQLNATARARFVVTPESWFDIESLAARCAEAGIALDLQTRDRGGAVPTAALSAEDLAMLRGAYAARQSALTPPQGPASLSPRAIGSVAAELRVVQLHRLRAETAGASPATETLHLPPPEHHWFADSNQRSWWLQQLFGCLHQNSVRSWLDNQLQQRREQLTERRFTWLRVLAQRLASDRHPTEVLTLLRELYAPPKQRKALIANDQQFATEFDLTRFGGPWSERLGLLHDRGRRRPFAIGKATPASGPADVTVLIPSFRHEQYIEETLRSVLAQDYAGFRVLVVDDRSPDDTVARASAVGDERIEVLVNPTNLGLGNSVLLALESIDTPYVALLNSDDLFHPRRLSRCREVLEQDPSIQLVTTGVTLVDSAGGQLTPTNASLVIDGKKVFDWVHWFERVTPSSDLPHNELFAALLERNFLVTSSNLVARTDWLRRQAPSLRSLKYCLDWQLFLEAALEGVLHHVHEPLIAYRLHASNTVWFREGRRWSYFLEVNRVAAEALQRYVTQERLSPDTRLLQVVDSVTRHLATNSEMDGLALFLNATLDPVQLDAAANHRPEVERLVEELNHRAEHLRELEHSSHVTTPQPPQQRELQVQLERLTAELAKVWADRARWLMKHGEEVEQRLASSLAYRDQLEAQKRALYTDLEQRGAYEQRLEAEKQKLLGDQQQRIAYARRLEEEKQQLLADQRERIEQERKLHDGQRELREQLAQARDQVSKGREQIEQGREQLTQEREKAARVREYATRLEQEKMALLADQEAHVARIRNLEQRFTAEVELAERARRNRKAAEQHAAELQTVLDTLRGELEAERTELAETVAGLEHKERQILDLQGTHDATLESLVTLEHAHREIERALVAEREALAKAESAIAERTAANQSLEDRLAAESAQVRATNDAKDQLTEQRNALLHKVANQQKEIERLLGTREFRTGNFLWNKLPLGYMSRRGKKWYRRLLDAKDRAGMWFKRNKRKAEGTAIVTACWQWPIYSHTFVYQEMVSLTHMGLDVRLFHWDLGDTEQLHAAFRYLYDNRTQLQPLWETHKKDMEHFEKTRPGRLRAFLERISPLCGKSVDELMKESIVRQGCTFARMAELAGAKYIHSYFFYDQSFMAMQAAWLLDLPRGVSCYADHMMNDYPWKFVPLHIELCDVIVATSARIKRELSKLSSGRFDDKIIVKPNGVDGERFTARKRPVRKVEEPFEVLSVSRIEPKKGLTYLVEAIAILKEKGHRVVAHVIGSKDPHSKGSLEYAAEFEDCIARHGLQDQVILHGMMKQEQMPPIIEKCRAFVAPYVETESGDKDGIPTAMLEALASSLPVVTTDSGSILEVIDNGVEGLVVPQRDSKAYAAALEKLITDPALEQRMAKAARTRFDRDFDIKVTEKRLHERIAGFLAQKEKAQAQA